ncbi:MAG: hypothetical protein ACFE8O_07135 [Candidatus Hermodarchaeota archaeon]
MKYKTTKILSITIGLCLLLAMSSMLVTTTSACRRWKTFVVAPSGNCEADTINIQAAFDMAAAAGPRSTVRLTKGTFYLCEPIVAVNFDGTFKGAGMDKTLINVPEDVEIPLPEDVNPFGVARLFLFYHTPDYPMSEHRPAYLSIRDLSIQVEGKAAPYDFFIFTEMVWLNAIDIIGKYTGIRDEVPTYLNVDCKRIRIEGKVGNYWPFGVNVNNGIQIAPGTIGGEFNNFPEHANPYYGTIKVSHCEFINTDSAFSLGGTIIDSKILFYRNTLHHAGTWFGGDFSNSRIFMFCNTWENIKWGTVSITQGLQSVAGYYFYDPHGTIPELSDWWIFCNTFEGITNLLDSIYLEDLVDPGIALHLHCNRLT